jgi:hypothetical protein
MMKKLILTSMLSVTLLSSCSWIFGKDKNELQPKLSSAPRTPINQSQQAPVMIGMNQPNQPELFVNQGVGLGTAPTAMPGMMPANPQMPPMAPNMMQPPMMAPQPYGMQPPVTQPFMPAQPPVNAPVPPQVTGSNEPVVIAQISKTKKLPASLMPTYNNPLNSAQVIPAQPVAPQQAVIAPSAIPADAGAPQIRPVVTPGNAPPTMPVEQMQINNQPVAPVR